MPHIALRFEGDAFNAVRYITFAIEAADHQDAVVMVHGGVPLSSRPGRVPELSPGLNLRGIEVEDFNIGDHFPVIIDPIDGHKAISRDPHQCKVLPGNAHVRQL